MARDRLSNPRSFSIRCLLTAGRMLESTGDPDEIGVDNLRLNLKSVGIRDRANSKIFHKFEEIISLVLYFVDNFGKGIFERKKIGSITLVEGAKHL